MFLFRIVTQKLDSATLSITATIFVKKVTLPAAATYCLIALLHWRRAATMQRSEQETSYHLELVCLSLMVSSDTIAVSGKDRAEITNK